MTTMNVKVPDSLVKQAQEMAEKEDVTLDQLVSSALAEKVAAWKTIGYLESRAQNSNMRWRKCRTLSPKTTTGCRVMK